jgi:hypothetical protein
MGEDIGLAYHELLGLREEEGGNALEVRGEELARSGEDVNEPKQGRLIQRLNCSYHLLRVGTVLTAVKEYGNIGVRRH